MSTSDGIPLGAQADPFAQVLESLKGSVSIVEVVQQPLSNVSEFVSVVDTVLDNLNEVPKVATVLSDIVSAIGSLVNVLDAVPIVQAVAALAGQVLEAIGRLLNLAKQLFEATIRPIITACKPIFADMKKGLAKAEEVIGTIALKVPNYINTVQILNYMAEIAVALVPLLKGTEAGDRLGKLTKMFEDLKGLVTSACSPIAAFLEAIKGVIEAVVAALGSVYGQIKRTVQDAMVGLQAIQSFFRPVEDAFNAITNAIKPIRWALDAIAFIFNKVVAPVINEILKRTGIDAELRKLVQKVEEKLGIRAVADLLGGKIDQTEAALWQKAAGEGAAAAAQTSWKTLEEALKNYNTRDAEGTKKNMLLLVNAILGSSVQDGPVPIPEWPEDPEIDGSEKADRALLTAQGTGLRRAQRIAVGFDCMAGLAAAEPPWMAGTPPLLVMHLDAMRNLRVADTMSRVTELQAAATAAEQRLADVHKAGPLMMSNLAAFAGARHLPADFQEEMTDLSDLFQYSSELVEFLVKTFGNQMPALITSLDKPLKAHAQQAGALYNQATGLVAAAGPLDAAIAQVAGAMPSDRIFSETIRFIDAAASGSKTLAAAITEAVELDRQLGGRFSGRLAAVAAQVDGAAAGATKRLSDVSGLADAVLGQVKAINQFLSDYGAKFAAMSADAQLVSEKAMPNLRKGTHIVGVIASILDPLSCLLEQAKCVDADNPVKPKGSARLVVDTFQVTMKNRIANESQALQAAFGFVLDAVVPLPRLAAGVQAINGFIAGRKADLDRQVAGLQKNLAALTAAMKVQPTYPVNVEKTVDGRKKTVTVEVANVLVDEKFVSAASALFGEIQAAAREAGIITDT